MLCLCKSILSGMLSASGAHTSAATCHSQQQHPLRQSDLDLHMAHSPSIPDCTPPFLLWADRITGQGMLKLLNIETGLERLSEVEFAVAFLLVLFLTEEPKNVGSSK